MLSLRANEPKYTAQPLGKNGYAAGETVRVLVADCTRMGTELVLEALRQDARFKGAGVSASPEEFIAAVSEVKPDVLVVGADAHRNARQSYALLRQGLACCSKAQAVMLLESSTRDLVVEAFRSAVRGVICRDAGLDALRKCIHAVHLGQIWATNEQLGFVLDVFSQRWVPQNVVDSQGRGLLSKRELDVVRCVSEGMTNRDIAVRLGLSEHTIKNYMFRTFDKLGVSSRSELILYAINHGCGSVAHPSSADVGNPASPAPPDTRADRAVAAAVS